MIPLRLEGKKRFIGPLDAKSVEVICKWRRWINIIYHDVDKLKMDKYVYEQVSKIIKKNKKINEPNIFRTFINHGYFTIMIMGVRRQVKSKKDNSISLLKLLKEMIKKTTIVDYYGFDKKTIERDIKEIEDKAERFECIADRYISHLDEGVLKEPINVADKEIREIFNCIYLKTSNYYLEFYRKVDHVDKILLGFKCDKNWVNIFKTPWIEEK